MSFSAGRLDAAVPIHTDDDVLNTRKDCLGWKSRVQTFHFISAAPSLRVLEFMPGRNVVASPILSGYQ